MRISGNAPTGDKQSEQHTRADETENAGQKGVYARRGWSTDQCAPWGLVLASWIWHKYCLGI